MFDDDYEDRMHDIRQDERQEKSVSDAAQIIAAHAHEYDSWEDGGSYRAHCACGWSEVCDNTDAALLAAHAAHVLAVLSETHAVVELPEPVADDTVYPYWSVWDVNGPQVVSVTDSDEAEPHEFWSIQFSARWRTVDVPTAYALGAAFFAAARSAEGGGSRG